MADYRDVDPNIGTLEDFDEMMKALKAEGIQVIVDIVPNHASDDHPWFQEALRSPKGSAARARFHFHDGEHIALRRPTLSSRTFGSWLTVITRKGSRQERAAQ